MILVRKPWDSQPQEAADVVNPSIVAAIPANGGGARVGAGSLYAKSFGLAFGSPGASDGWVLRATPVVSTSDVFVYGCVFSTTVSHRAQGHTIIGERGAAGNDLCSIVCGESGGSLNSVRVYVRNTAGTLIFMTGTAAVNDGLLHTAVLVKRAANSWEFYLDGVSVGTNTTSLPGSGWTGNVPSYIAYDPQNTGALFNGVGLAFGIPGTSWTTAQAQAFHAMPWATIFAPRSIPVPVSAGGATGYTLTADAGAYTLAGQDATLLKTRIVTADAGSYAVGGQDASVLVGHKLTADAGAYSLAGQDATLTYVPVTPGAYTLTCDAGAYVLAGQDATLLRGRAVVADAGSYAVSGADAQLTYSGAQSSAAGGYGKQKKKVLKDIKRLNELILRREAEPIITIQPYDETDDEEALMLLMQ